MTHLMFISRLLFFEMPGLKNFETEKGTKVCLRQLQWPLTAKKGRASIKCFSVCALTFSSSLGISVVHATFRGLLTLKPSNLVWTGRWINGYPSSSKLFPAIQDLGRLHWKVAAFSFEPLKSRDWRRLCFPASSDTLESCTGQARSKSLQNALSPYIICNKSTILYKVTESCKHGYAPETHQTEFLSTDTAIGLARDSLDTEVRVVLDLNNAITKHCET